MKNIIYKFISRHKLGVVSTINQEGKPESALVGIAVSENLEIVFDTVSSSRKYANILRNQHVSLVIGWDNETTVQYEGVAGILGTGKEADSYRELYFEAYPDGRERVETWPGLVHIKIAPKWVRYSNFNEPVIIEEVLF